MKHLTDDQIQSYLDGDQLNKLLEIEKHLKNCVNCQFQLNAYQNLYKVIGNTEEELYLNPSFTGDTISKIEKNNEKKVTLFENILIAFTFIVSISFSVYFFNLTGFLTYFIQIDFSWFTGIVKKLTDAFSPNIIYLAAATLIIGIIELFDRFKIQKFIK